MRNTKHPYSFWMHLLRLIRQKPTLRSIYLTWFMYYWYWYIARSMIRAFGFRFQIIQSILCVEDFKLNIETELKRQPEHVWYYGTDGIHFNFFYLSWGLVTNDEQCSILKMYVFSLNSHRFLRSFWVAALPNQSWDGIFNMFWNYIRIEFHNLENSSIYSGKKNLFHIHCWNYLLLYT